MRSRPVLPGGISEKPEWTDGSYWIPGSWDLCYQAVSWDNYKIYSEQHRKKERKLGEIGQS